MASSLININQATSDQLQHLKHIGPKRAARIIQYREQVAPINSEYELAAVTGLSIGQISMIRGQMSLGETSNPLNLWQALLGAALVLAPFVYSIATVDLSIGKPAELLFNLSLILVLTGALLGMLFFVGEDLSLGASRLNSLSIMALTLVSLGITVMLAASALTMYAPHSVGFSAHLSQVWLLLFCLAVVAYLLYFPTLHLRVAHQLPRPWLQDFRVVTGLFDFSQLPVAWLILLSGWLTTSPGLLWEIFYCWAGVILGSHGYDLMNFRSSYIQSLHELDRSRLAFLAGDVSGLANLNHRDQPVRTRVSGILLQISAVALLISGLSGIIGTITQS
ncbi:MAG: helix-hairpin-helix domain-containing protein [Pseudomonadales bacterium]|nr:helix-hairpin-helix domain-containing protein [Pseudomonadales bacterium]